MSASGIRARLLAKTGELSGTTFDVGREATIGRSSDNTVVLPVADVSGKHARIYYDPEAERYYLEDLGSRNGTELDGLRVTRPERLGRMHVIRFAGTLDLVYLGPEIAAALPPAAADTVQAEPPGKETEVDAEPPSLPASLASPGQGDPGAAVAPASSAVPGSRTEIDAEPPLLPPSLGSPQVAAAESASTRESGPDPVPGGSTQVDAEPPVLPQALGEADETSPPRFSLVVTNLGPVTRYPLNPGENVVGRGSSAGIAIESPEISRRHAVLTVEGDEVRVRDEGSRNHTYLSDDQVGADRPVAPGARLRFGSVEAELQQDSGGGLGR